MKGKGLLALVTATMCTIAVAGCSSDSGSSSSSSTISPKQAVCADRTDLKNSVDDLRNLSVANEGKSGVESALKKVQKNIDALGQSAKKAYQPDVDAVKSALDQLQTAVNDFGNQSVSQSVEAVGTAISKVGQATSRLVSEVQSGCPS